MRDGIVNSSIPLEEYTMMGIISIDDACMTKERAMPETVAYMLPRMERVQVRKDLAYKPGKGAPWFLDLYRMPPSSASQAT